LQLRKLDGDKEMVLRARMITKLVMFRDGVLFVLGWVLWLNLCLFCIFYFTFLLVIYILCFLSCM